MSKLQIKDIYFKYQNDYVIKNVTLSIEANTINVLIGLNGSGKTTLIKMLAGIYKPNQGSIHINDRELFSYSFHERSKTISYVAQGIDIGDDYYVEDYLSFGLMNTLKFYQSPSNQNMNYVREAAKKFNIYQFLGKKMNQLSGGERQIVSICRAYIQNTDIIILDEPTSALDIKNQSLVLRILKEIASVGKTIILSTHNPNHALYLNSHAILIHEGEVLNYGISNEVVTLNQLEPIYGENIKYSKELHYDEVTLG